MNTDTIIIDRDTQVVVERAELEALKKRQDELTLRIELLERNDYGLKQYFKKMAEYSPRPRGRLPR